MTGSSFPFDLVLLTPMLRSKIFHLVPQLPRLCKFFFDLRMASVGSVSDHAMHADIEKDAQKMKKATASQNSESKDITQSQRLSLPDAVLARGPFDRFRSQEALDNTERWVRCHAVHVSVAVALATTLLVNSMNLTTITCGASIIRMEAAQIKTDREDIFWFRSVS